MTNAAGLISISDLDEEWVVISELSSIDGYKIDKTPKYVEVKSDVATIVEFENHPYASLVIQKIDSVTGKGIENVKFNITKENGEYIGNFETDEFGYIKFSKTLLPSTYLVKEISTLDNYQMDDTTHKVELNWGDNKIIQIKNHPFGSLRVTKIDSKTKEKLEGVRYRLETDDGELIGKYTTNEDGQIFIENKLVAGNYYLIEIDSLDNYVTDTEKHKVVIEWGKTTTIELKNTEITGKIKIVKRSSDNNSYTGELAGTFLKGAVFIIRDEKNNVVEKVTTDSNGIAITKSLPYGVYKLTEEKAPDFYMKSNNEYNIEIKENNCIEVVEVFNDSIKLATSIEKTGVKETQCLDTIRYDFNNIKNNSNVALDNFTWHESLPIETQIQKLYTGTWNQNLVYSVKYKTNCGTSYRVLVNNLFTNQVYELDFTNIALQKDEYVTDIVFEFGTVEAGFTQVQAPIVYTKVNNYLKDGTEIINYTEVFGFYNNYKVSGNSSWKTLIFNKTLPKIKLPKTGW